MVDEAGPEGLALLSTTLNAHAERTAAWLVERFSLGPGSRVLEASSHGNHLGHLLAGRGIPVVALEPDVAVADGLRARGIEVLPTSVTAPRPSWPPVPRPTSSSTASTSPMPQTSGPPSPARRGSSPRRERCTRRSTT